MERCLTGPMVRGTHLHSYYLLRDVLPTSSGPPAASQRAVGQCPFAKGDDTFLLSLDSLGEPDEPHALLRGLMFDYLLDDAAAARAAMSDANTRALLTTFKAAYEQQRAAGEFLWSDRELPELVLRWVHYALFGVLLDSAQYETLRLLYLAGDGSSPSGTKYHFFPGGGLVGGRETVAGTGRRMSELRAAAVELYVRSPGLRDYRDDAPLGKRDFCVAMLPIMTLAGIAGPLSAAQGLLRGQWHGEVPDAFPLPVDDREKLRLVVLESQRLRPSVFGTALEPRTPFTLQIGGAAVTFPPGTPLVLNYRTAGTQESVWHKPRHFLPYERAAQLWGPQSSFWAFNSAGDKTGGDLRTGRMCPGRDLALTFLLDLLQVLHGAGRELKFRFLFFFFPL